MRVVMALALVVGFAGSSAAQTVVVPGQGIEWTQLGQSVATAQGYEYWAYVDALPPVQFTGVACRLVLTNAVCTSTLPPMTPGADHTLQMTQYDARTPGRESARSVVLILRLPPAALVTPTNIQLPAPATAKAP